MMFQLMVVLAVAAFATYHKLPRFARGMALASFFLLLVAGCGLLPQWLAMQLQGNPPTTFTDWGRRNVIILLGAGSTPEPHGGPEATMQAMPRIVRAVSLYQDCRQGQRDCLVEISGGDTARLGRPEADIYRDVVTAMGVAPQDLLVERESLNTFQNAQMSVAILDRHRPDRIVLVSSALHLPRATLYFRHFGIPVHAVRADYAAANLSLLPSTGNLTLTDVLLHEYVGMLQYRVYEFMGWNKQAVVYTPTGT